MMLMNLGNDQVLHVQTLLDSWKEEVEICLISHIWDPVQEQANIQGLWSKRGMPFLGKGQEVILSLFVTGQKA